MPFVKGESHAHEVGSAILPPDELKRLYEVLRGTASGAVADAIKQLAAGKSLNKAQNDLLKHYKDFFEFLAPKLMRAEIVSRDGADIEIKHVYELFIADGKPKTTSGIATASGELLEASKQSTEPIELKSGVDEGPAGVDMNTSP